MATRPETQGESESVFNLTSAPAAATAATVTKTAAPTKRNVCTYITCSLVNGAAQATIVEFVLRDGATGAGDVLWRAKLAIPAVSGSVAYLVVPDLWIVGSANTAMTLETVAAPSANCSATVSMSGMES